MIIFALLGGIILVLATVLAWRDHRARRQGAQISYEHGRVLQGRVDADLKELYHLSMRHPHDPMSQPPPDQPEDRPRTEYDVGLIDGPLGRHKR
jgi:hypothetical protein